MWQTACEPSNAVEARPDDRVIDLKQFHVAKLEQICHGFRQLLATG
jgi:hypothetical protein